MTPALTPAYAGIGSRATPPAVQARMTKIADRLQLRGWILRSGGADGADLAFERGTTAPAAREIYLPWAGFNGNTSALHPPSQEAYDIAARHHPAWSSLPRPVRALMARNAHQILGRGLDAPVRMVICWTADGCEHASTRTRATGGTGLAIALASSLDIPIINLAHADALERIGSIVRSTR